MQLSILCFSKEYLCHHSNYNRVEALYNKKGKSKNCACEANIKICIKRTTKDTKKKDKYVKVRVFKYQTLCIIYTNGPI